MTSLLGLGNTSLQPLNQLRQSRLNAQRVLWRLLGANFNTMADQALSKVFSFSEFKIQSIRISNPSISLTTAVGGFYLGASKSGLAVVSASQVYTQLTQTYRGLSVTVSAEGLGKITSSNLFFALTTAQGAAATADIEVVGHATS